MWSAAYDDDFMCGVAGLLDATRAGSASLGPVAVAMAASLTHRGPDAEGSYVDEPAGYAVGHRRLSIIDLSLQGAQPMTSASGRWVLAYNGELYNHRDLRAELVSTGVRFRGHSDTETLVEAIDAWGIDTALARTNAMFAFAAWDRAERVLHLARDRMGEKPLYWYADDRRLIFASELRALRAVPGFRPGLDAGAATAVLRWSFVPQPRTILSGVRQLAPGGLLTARLDGDRLTAAERRWWSLTDTIADAVAVRGSATAESAADEVVPLLADAVTARLESDVPLGSFLSGGIDSSLVAALAQQALGATPLRTFTVKMPELGFDEAAHAEAVARHLGTDHTTVELTAAEVMAQIPTLARVWDEPFADPSMLPSLLLCRTARQQLTVCLAGDGGDEVFAGYNRHSLGQSLWRRASRLPVGARRRLGRLVLAPSPARIDAMARRAGAVLSARMRLPNPGDKAQKAGAVLQADTHDLWAALAQVWPADVLRWSKPLRPASLPGLDPIEEMLLTDTAVVLPDQMLVKVDRASMAASLEVRVPFLDHRVLEWAWRQPLSVRTSGGVGKVVLRRALAGMVPADIVERPKMGFDPPLATWLRGPLRPWAAELVARPRCVAEGWLSGAALQQAWVEHQAGTRNWDYRLWAVLMLESWLAEWT